MAAAPRPRRCGSPGLGSPVGPLPPPSLGGACWPPPLCVAAAAPGALSPRCPLLAVGPLSRWCPRRGSAGCCTTVSDSW
eukprot:7482047-Alexandrium_andersonii.AAC.1